MGGRNACLPLLYILDKIDSSVLTKCSLATFADSRYTFIPFAKKRYKGAKWLIKEKAYSLPEVNEKIALEKNMSQIVINIDIGGRCCKIKMKIS